MDGRWIVKADAVVELTLGALLVVGAAAGVLASSAFPHPVGRALVVVVGLLLVGFGLALWRTPLAPRVLAIGNASTAVLAIVWLAAASGFSTAGAAFVGAAVAALLCLAAAQLAARGS